MIYREEKMNLFSVPQGYMLAHCISGDFTLGAGIAKEMDRIFNMKEMLNLLWGPISPMKDKWSAPCCLPCANVFNLVTKEKYWHKPTLASLRTALEEMYSLAVKMGVTKIAMPKISCGLDRLDWEKVSPMIQEIFADTDIEILVCVL